MKFINCGATPPPKDLLGLVLFSSVVWSGAREGSWGKDAGHVPVVWVVGHRDRPITRKSGRLWWESEE
jgi:hypothetical protein